MFANDYNVVCMRAHFWKNRPKKTKNRPVPIYGRSTGASLVRSILPGLRRKRTGLLLSGLKSYFQIKVNFAFHLEIKVWRKTGEAHNPSCLKSSVKFLKSVMIWGAVTSAGVGPLCFIKSKVNATIYQEILEHFMLPSANKLYGDADFLFQQDFSTCPQCQNHFQVLC